MSAHGIVDQIAADWREVIDGHDPGTDWGPDAKRLVDLALEGARRIENKRALRQAKVRLWCHRLGLIPEPERPKPVLPRRIQRRVGQPLPPGAVFVGKGSRWANPLRAELVDGQWTAVGVGLSGPLPWPCNTKERANWWVIEMFRQHIAPTLDLEPLRGKDLACWCPPGAPCHADVLLLLANGGPSASLYSGLAKITADKLVKVSEPAVRWADLFGAAPNYTGGVPVDEWLEAHRD